MRNKLYRTLECSLLATGATLLVVFAAALVYRSIISRVALARFDQAQVALTQKDAQPNLKAQGDGGVDERFWSRKRIRDYRKSLFMKIDPPMAVFA